MATVRKQQNFGRVARLCVSGLCLLTFSPCVHMGLLPQNECLGIDVLQFAWSNSAASNVTKYQSKSTNCSRSDGFNVLLCFSICFCFELLRFWNYIDNVMHSWLWWYGTWNLAGESDSFVLCAFGNFLFCIARRKLKTWIYLHQTKHNS